MYSDILSDKNIFDTIFFLTNIALSLNKCNSATHTNMAFELVSLRLAPKHCLT